MFLTLIGATLQSPHSEVSGCCLIMELTMMLPEVMQEMDQSEVLGIRSASGDNAGSQAVFSFSHSPGIEDM